MDTICRVEIHHGGEFKTREGVYYYKGGTIDNIYNVDVSALTVDRFLNFLHEIGYGNGLKLYYQKPLTTGKESYIFLWNNESVRASPRAKCIMVGYIDWLYGLCKFFAKRTCICSNGIIYNFACVKLYLRAHLVRQI